MIHPGIYGSKDCTAEILMQAADRIGRTIRNEFGLQEMKIADAIADVCISNAQGALDAFAALHEATGAPDLREWQMGKPNYQIAAVMRETARKIAS